MPRLNLNSKFIIAKNKHNIARDRLSKAALKVLTVLAKSNYQAFLIGGAVRDLLLNIRPKDFDIATDATPQQVRSLFKHSRIIGRRFKLVHVIIGGDIIEVSTFRAQAKSENRAVLSPHGMIIDDNIFGNIEEDAKRRDFTVNALYYNIQDGSVIDFFQGYRHLQNQVIHMIGDANQRYIEDPVRILRAIRFASKLSFALETNTSKKIEGSSSLLTHVPSARLYDEYKKLFLTGHAYSSYLLLQKYKLFTILFPTANFIYLQQEVNIKWNIEKFIALALKNTDIRIEKEKTVNPAFLLAAILWPSIFLLHYKFTNLHHDKVQYALNAAIKHILSVQHKTINLTKYLSQAIFEILSLQYNLANFKVKDIKKIHHHRRFRAAYDFMLIRAEAHNFDVNIAKWWQKYEESKSEKMRKKLIIDLRKLKKTKETL